MRARQVRLFSMSDVARIDRDFQPVSADSLALAALPPEERSGFRLAALAGLTGWFIPRRDHRRADTEALV